MTCSQRQLAGGGTLAAFINEKGWDAFRKEEVRVLQGILSGNTGQPTWSNDVDGVDPEQQQQLVACPVVSTGGGIVETLEVIDAQWYY
jgi:shikimate kinase